mgnify:FL=1|jgi:large subunit ribosomal protein L16|tara:strand:+ start:258 stop:656 length:399 start_codon:yes stop_codon:yes gene_type:complete
MLRPKQVKFRKQRKSRIRGIETRSVNLTQGSYGLKAKESGRITARQIEATRRAITRKMKRKGRVWIKIFPSVPITSKPVEVRMGKGKGNVNYWVSPVRQGQILYEVGGVTQEIGLQALRAGANKLPVLTKII